MAEEKQFENKVKAYLEEQGCWYLKYWGGGMFTKAGIPDLLCCVNGYFLAIELKASKGNPSALQLNCQEEIINAKGISLILYPSEFDKFKHLIQMLKRYPNKLDSVLYSYSFGVKR